MRQLLPWLIGILLFESALYFHWRMDLVFVATIFLIVIYRWLRRSANVPPNDRGRHAPDAPIQAHGFQEDLLREKPPIGNEKPR